MSKQHDRITKNLLEIGACWATSSSKFVSDDTGKAAYHIHPNANNPHRDDVLRFYSLNEIEGYVNARKEAAEANEIVAYEIMQDFWASLG
jgi:hypothetical protein